MNVELRPAAEKLEVVCSGRLARADFLRVVDAIASAREQDPRLRKCLMDASAADIDLDGLAEYLVGEYAAKRLAGMRFSLLIPSGRTTKLLENAAYNRGLHLLLTLSRPEAEAWLSGD